MNYYGIDYDDNSLAHYGVLGMKWGVRKANKLRAKGSKYNQKAKNASTDSKKNKYKKKADKAYKNARWLEEDMAIDQDYKKFKSALKESHKHMKSKATNSAERSVNNAIHRQMNTFNKDQKFIKQVANNPRRAKTANYIKGSAKALGTAGLAGAAAGLASGFVSPGLGKGVAVGGLVKSLQAFDEMDRKTALANKVIESKNKGYDVSRPRVMQTDLKGHIKDITYDKKKKKG